MEAKWGAGGAGGSHEDAIAVSDASVSRSADEPGRVASHVGVSGADDGARERVGGRHVRQAANEAWAMNLTIEDVLKKWVVMDALENLNLEALIAELAAEKEKKFEEPAEYDEAQEKLVRELMEKVAQYAESGPLWDASGKYLCEACEMRIEPDRCSHVSGDISMATGSCEKWVIGPQSWPRQTVQWTQKEANYGTREKAKGFGCSRCGHGTRARQTDDAGRAIWCDRFGTRVQALACCAEESGPDFVLAPGE